MRRAALAVLLSFCVPLILFGQRGGGGGSDRSSGGSSSGGYSGGYSGGSYETHSSSSSSGSESRSSSSGGSSSSSLGSSSRGDSGSSRSNSGASGSSHSGTGGGGSRSSSGSSAARSNARSGKTDSSGSYLHSSGNSSSAESRTGFQPSFGNPAANAEWLQQAGALKIETPVLITDLDKARQQRKMDAALSQLGLEPTRQAYDQKMAALRSAEKQSEKKNQSKLSRFFFGVRATNQSPAARPCAGKDCPKPCRGRNCTLPPPLPQASRPPTPWGYIERCDNATCYAHLTHVDVSRCTDILKREQVEEQQADLLKTAQQNACSANLQSAGCNAASGDYKREQLVVDQLRKQYQMCLSAAGYAGSTGLTAPPWSP